MTEKEGIKYKKLQPHFKPDRAIFKKAAESMKKFISLEDSDDITVSDIPEEVMDFANGCQGSIRFIKARNDYRLNVKNAIQKYELISSKKFLILPKQDYLRETYIGVDYSKNEISIGEKARLDILFAGRYQHRLSFSGSVVDKKIVIKSIKEEGLDEPCFIDVTEAVFVVKECAFLQKYRDWFTDNPDGSLQFKDIGFECEVFKLE